MGCAWQGGKERGGGKEAWERQSQWEHLSTMCRIALDADMLEVTVRISFVWQVMKQCHD